MAKSENLGSVKRFGARYGRKVKDKLAKIESQQRAKYVCPYCRKKTVKRKAIGIWECRSCDTIMTGKAYSLAKKLSVSEKAKTEEDIDVDKLLEPEKEEDYSEEKEGEKKVNEDG